MISPPCHRLSLRRYSALVALACALAAGNAHADRPTKEAQTEAQVHFKRARDLYQAGSYKDAIVELEEARKLDPEARDLVFNLGVVSEKLSRIDDALRYFRTYLEMPNVTAQEKSRAEGFIRRSDKEFIQFLYISMSSSAEVRSHLYVALDQSYIDQTLFDKIYGQSDKVGKMISNLIKYLRGMSKSAK